MTTPNTPARLIPRMTVVMTAAIPSLMLRFICFICYYMLILSLYKTYTLYVFYCWVWFILKPHPTLKVSISYKWCGLWQCVYSVHVNLYCIHYCHHGNKLYYCNKLENSFNKSIDIHILSFLSIPPP